MWIYYADEVQNIFENYFHRNTLFIGQLPSLWKQFDCCENRLRSSCKWARNTTNRDELMKNLQYLIKRQNKRNVKCDRSWLFWETCFRKNQSEIKDQNSGITILVQPNQDLACCTEDEACEMVSAGDKTCEDLPYFENFVGERTC